MFSCVNAEVQLLPPQPPPPSVPSMIRPESQPPQRALVVGMLSQAGEVENISRHVHRRVSDLQLGVLSLGLLATSSASPKHRRNKETR